MSALRVCIVGGGGFVGRNIAGRLAEAGHRIVVITRRRERHRALLVLPQLQLVEGDAGDAASLTTAFRGMDAVINLVGILNEQGHKGRGFQRAHVGTTENILQACADAGVNRLLHMSALNADPSGPSHYLRTKGRAENLAHTTAANGLHVTSFRPSVIFGPGDSFFNRFAGLLQSVPCVFPLACGQARFQPVYVQDVAAAFVASLTDHHTFGQRYNLCGPNTYTLHELVAYTAGLIGLRRRIVDLPNWLSALQAAVMEFAPGKPFSLDNYHSLKVDSVCREGFPARFGITPRSVEEIAPGYLRPRFDPYDDYRRVAGR
jgi:uncharacterized protein YbjT (DUF2867 family)